MLFHLQLPLPLDTDREPLLSRRPPSRRILPCLLPDPHAVQKRLSYLGVAMWSIVGLRLFNWCWWRGRSGQEIFANGRGAGLIRFSAFGISVFEDSEDGGVGFLAYGSGALSTLGDLSRFFGGAHCYRRRRGGHKRPKVLSQFLDIDLEMVLGRGVEMSCFGVRMRGLSNSSTEFSFLVFSLQLVWRRGELRGGFYIVNSGGDGVDNVGRARF